MVSLFWKAKGADRAILVTDGISATGMPEGTYHLGALQVEVTNGKCTSGGVLAGSVLTLDRAVSNFSAFTGATLAQTVALAARNPARMIGLDREIGSLAVGRFADIAVLRPDGSIAATILKGCLVYNAGELLRSSS
jgi:N-acetylglucosamine-6-phosphate deacetylase